MAGDQSTTFTARTLPGTNLARHGDTTQQKSLCGKKIEIPFTSTTSSANTLLQTTCTSIDKGLALFTALK